MYQEFRCHTLCLCVLQFCYPQMTRNSFSAFHSRCRSSSGQLTCFLRRWRGRRSAALTRYHTSKILLKSDEHATLIWRKLVVSEEGIYFTWSGRAGASAGRRGGVHLLEAFRGQRQEGGHEVPQAAAAQEHPHDHLPRRRVAALAYKTELTDIWDCIFSIWWSCSYCYFLCVVSGLFTGTFVSLFIIYSVLAHVAGIFSSTGNTAYMEIVYHVFRQFLNPTLQALGCTYNITSK